MGTGQRSNGCSLPTVPVLSVCGASAQNPTGAVISTTDTQTLYVYGTGSDGFGRPLQDVDVDLHGRGGCAQLPIRRHQHWDDLVDRVECDGPLWFPTILSLPAFSADLLAPGQSETCTGQYTTTSTDVTNLGVTNTGTVNGNDVDYFLPVTASSTKTIAYTGP